VLGASLYQQVCLVHHFFSSSPLHLRQWRIMYRVMRDKELLTQKQLADKAYTPPDFDPKVCARVCASGQMLEWFVKHVHPSLL